VTISHFHSNYAFWSLVIGISPVPTSNSLSIGEHPTAFAMSSRTPSARLREEQQAASREGLLSARRTSPQDSNDEINKAPEDEEAVNKLDPSNGPTIELSNRKTKRKRRPPTREEDKKPRTWRERCKPSKICLFIIAVAIVVLVASLGSLGAYAIKNGPKDGLSPPWYPTPRGGTVKSWEESYKKAHAMVEKMTLVEKVNVTTGVGWQMGLCVGNTGTITRLLGGAQC
jgi:hypothetical protein